MRGHEYYMSMTARPINLVPVQSQLLLVEQLHSKLTGSEKCVIEIGNSKDET